MNAIREPAVAGLFYPENTHELRTAVQDYLVSVPPTDHPAPKALIVPHAGYHYSGPVAANAYAILRAYRDRYTRVVLLGPSHREPLRGLALSEAHAWSTPLGEVPIDHQGAEALIRLGVRHSDTSHSPEHSLEVHLPFLQTILESFSLMPILVGDASAEEVEDVLDDVWDGPETLIVISTDLSHYLPYEEARSVDAATCDAIKRCDDRSIGFEEACGATPLRGLLLSAKRRGLKVRTLDLRNSGDTVGTRYQVVGYGAWSFCERGTTMD